METINRLHCFFSGHVFFLKWPQGFLNRPDKRTREVDGEHRNSHVLNKQVEP